MPVAQVKTKIQRSNLCSTANQFHAIAKQGMVTGMAQRIKTLAANPVDLTLTLGPTWCRGRANHRKLFSDIHSVLGQAYLSMSAIECSENLKVGPLEVEDHQTHRQMDGDRQTGRQAGR